MSNPQQLLLALVMVGAFACAYYLGSANSNLWLSAVMPLPIMAIGSFLLGMLVRRDFLRDLPTRGQDYLVEVRDANRTRGWMILPVLIAAAVLVAAGSARESYALMAGAGIFAGMSFLALSMRSAFKLQASQ